MKKFPFVLTLVLVMCLMIPIAQADFDVCQETEIVHTEFGDFEVTTTTVFYNSLARSSRGADKIAEVKFGSETIAKVTLSATFGFDGKTAWVVSASGSHTTYNGWSYGSEKITKSGGTASLSAVLTHSTYGNKSVNISLTCSPTGQIS